MSGVSSISDENRDKIIADYKAGLSLLDLVAKHKMAKSTLYAMLKREGVAMHRPHRTNGKRGVKMKAPSASSRKKRRSPLTTIERAAIIKDYKAGMLQEDIVKKHHVCKDSIWRVVKAAGVPLRGKMWKKRAYVKKASSWKTSSSKKASSSKGSSSRVTNGIVKFSRPGSMTASMFDELVREHHTAEQRAEAIENLFQHWPR